MSHFFAVIKSFSWTVLVVFVDISKYLNVFSLYFFDWTEYIYPNGVKVLVKAMKQLETIPSTGSGDRLYVNTSFTVFFSDKYIKKRIKKCKKLEISKLREEVLKILRESDRHQTMKGKHSI